MRRLFLMLLSLAGIFFCKGQTPSWGFTFTPSVVTTSAPHYGLQLGGEFLINTRLSLITEFTFLVKSKPSLYEEGENYFRIKPELRYFLSGQNDYKGAYAGFQLSYSFRSWKDMNGGSYFEDKVYDDTAITFQSAVLRSPVFTSSVQLGALFTLGEHFGMDFFIGTGVRVINTTYTNLQGTGKTYAIRPKCKILIAPDPAWWVNGTISRVHFNAGLRFLYRF